jgi:hypothetical protein
LYKKHLLNYVPTKNFKLHLLPLRTGISLQLKPIKMKKMIVCAMASIMSFTFIPLQSAAAAKTASSMAVTGNAAETATANALMGRLQEIRQIDASTLSAPEKKELRKEVRSIKQQLRGIGGGVYISTGALILIIILLIILL